MPLSPTSLRLLQTVGLTTTSILAGASASFSVVAIPRLLQSPTPTLLKQFKYLYESGKRSMPKATILAASTFLYLAYDSRAAGSDVWRGYVAAAALAVGILPYTLLVMMGTNKVLLEKADEVEANKEVSIEAASVKQLVDQWATMNLGRSILLTSSALLATWTALA